jgi:hypothetical protein
MCCVSSSRSVYFLYVFVVFSGCVARLLYVLLVFFSPSLFSLRFLLCSVGALFPKNNLCGGMSCDGSMYSLCLAYLLYVELVLFSFSSRSLRLCCVQWACVFQKLVVQRHVLWWVHIFFMFCLSSSRSAYFLYVFVVFSGCVFQKQPVWGGHVLWLEHVLFMVSLSSLRGGDMSCDGCISSLCFACLLLAQLVFFTFSLGFILE